MEPLTMSQRAYISLVSEVNLDRWQSDLVLWLVNGSDLETLIYIEAQCMVQLGTRCRYMHRRP